MNGATTTISLSSGHFIASPPQPEEGFIDTKGLALHFKLCTRKIDKLRKAGVLPYYEFPLKCIRFKIKECEEAVKEFRHKGIAG
jgi:hypothetical protein